MAGGERSLMSLSVRTRFEIFKRDRFTCAYCGQTPPNVLLECDHVVPRAAGGSDEIENLITACQDCNRGKSSRLLDESFAPTISRETAEDAQEALAQAKAYVDAVTAERALFEHLVALVWDGWAKAFGAERVESADGTSWVFNDYQRFPEERSVRSILRRLPLATVLEAIDITAGRMRRANQDGCRYFYGVCWRMVRERES
jgi:HNH endonuclease